MKKELIEALNNIEKKLNKLEETIIIQAEQISNLKISHEELYKELYRKKKKIENLEKSKTERCRNDK